MQGKFALTLLFHVVGLVLLLIPNRFQGPVVTNLLGVKLRTLDVTGIVLIIVGSVIMNIYLFVSLRKQIKKIKQMSPQDGAGKIE